MTQIDITQFLARIEAVQRDCVPETKGTFQHPYADSATYPYWTSEVLRTAPSRTSSNIMRYDVTIVMRLYEAKFDSGKNDSRPPEIYNRVFQVLDYFEANPSLVTDALPDILSGLDPTSTVIVGEGVGPFDASPRLEIGSTYTLTFSIYKPRGLP